MKPFPVFAAVRPWGVVPHFFCRFLILFLTAVGVHATTIVPPAFDELVNQADYAVHAVVKSINCEWKSNGASLHIVTKLELDVKQIIFGAPPTPLVIEMLGGTIGDRRMVVHGSPEFKVGDEDILFVHGNGAQMNPLVALGHGRYPVKRDKQTGRVYITRSNGDPLYNEGETALPLSSTSVRRETVDKGQPLTLDAFAARIRESRQNYLSTHEK